MAQYAHGNVVFRPFFLFLIAVIIVRVRLGGRL